MLSTYVIRRGQRPALLWTTLLLGLATGSCAQDPTSAPLPWGSAMGGSGNPGSGGSAGSIGITFGGGVGIGGLPASGPCSGLACQQTTCTMGNCTQQACAAGTSTTVTGTVFDPAGKVPLYNVVVYVPSAPVEPFKDGASCDRCDATVLNPLASALTDTHGRFQLQNVPVGADIPLVIQIGKWRRQIKIPQVSACTDTPLTDPNLTRLPRNQMEGDIPRIAIATGGFDSMECLPRRMGLDDAEFTTDAGQGRIHLFSGGDLMGGGMMGMTTPATKAFAPTLNAGVPLTRATSLWNSVESLSRYDIVILSCEGGTIEQEKPMSSRQALYSYASAGGRVFASHWQRIWFSHGPDPVPRIGTWSDRQDPMDPITGTINTTFPKGQALAEWLMNVNASTVQAQLEIREARDNIQTVNPAYATEWIRIQNARYPRSATAIQYLTFNAPLGAAADQQCGRSVFTDLHVSSTGADLPGEPFPNGCEMRDLSPQEKAVEFMLFDLSACVRDDREVPMPPR